jgi:FkbM family methyltransferase
LNHMLCDGGLCNRLNALLFALMLQRRFGGAWQISWPRNNWCGAGFDSLFSSPLPHDDNGIAHYKQHEARHLLLMHENQAGFDSARWVPNRGLASWDDYRHQLQRHDSVVYYNNLLPPFVTDDDVQGALTLLQVNPQVAETARRFILERRIDASVLGVHIRKTDFGDRVDDDALFEQVRASDRPVFVCSDDAAVNTRFAALPRCSVVPKQAYPQKLQGQDHWQQATRDDQGRHFASNMQRSAEAVVEGLVDLLVLSQTDILPTSHSTFLATAQRFARCGYFRVHTTARVAGHQPPPSPTASAAPSPASSPAASSAPVTQADLDRLLAHLQTQPLLSDALVRVGPAGDGGCTVPLSALRARTALTVGDAPLPGGPVHWTAAGTHALHHADWPQPLPDGADLLCFDTGDSAWSALQGAGPDGLAGYGVISGALHGLAGLADRAYFDRAESLLARLASSHQLVHWRVRDAAGHFLLGGHPFPQVVEATWLARAGARFGPADTTPVLQLMAQSFQSRPDAPAAAAATGKQGFSLFPTLAQMGLPAPRGVLQVGASYGQEMREFLANGIGAGVFVEPLPQPHAHLVAVCEQLPNFLPVQALCAEATGQSHSFHVASNGGMSSSLLKPVNHLRVNAQVSFPDTVQLQSTTVTELLAGLRRSGQDRVVDALDLLYMDTQGAEFKVLLGAVPVLAQFKYLYFEVMRNDMYEGQTPFLAYAHLLEALGFTLNNVYFCHPEQTGNALFVRKDLVRVAA